MIGYLTGRIVERSERWLMIDVHGIGFYVFVTPKTAEQFPTGETGTLRTHLHIREDNWELYGFANQPEQRLFQKLLSVSGVGPRVAMSVLAAANVEDLEQAINNGETQILTNVSGVGTKTAQRIIVDLRGKLAEVGTEDSSVTSVMEALMTLGYSNREAREAAAATSSSQTVEERIKQALKLMGR